MGPLPTWPYYFLSAMSAVLGAALLAVWWPRGYPGQGELVKISGSIDTVVVRDDISKTSAGAILPAMTSVYFKLEGVEGEFRYPSTHPKYPLVRDQTAVAIDVWVVEAEIGTAAPMTIWQIQEHNPYRAASELTYVDYAEIIERLHAADRSMVEAGYWLLAACGGFVLLGVGVGRWNRSRPDRLA